MSNPQSDFYAELADSTTGAQRYLLNGVWSTSSSGKTVEILNPSKGGVVFTVQGVRMSRSRRLSPHFLRLTLASCSLHNSGG